VRFRSLIVDDEPFARNKILSFLKDFPDFEVVGECENGEQALTAILGLKPDVVFLDVEIPGQNGLELMGSLPKSAQPYVILVTAFDKYAVQAFEVDATDYLLKPFNRTRFAQTISRLRERTASASSVGRRNQVNAAPQPVRQEPQDCDRVLIKSGSGIIFLRSSLIEWVEAQGDYVMIHVGKTNHLVRETMNRMASRLDPNRFVRIHRSAIVNFDCIRELHPLGGGDYRVLLRNGTQLTLSRSYRAALLDKLPSTISTPII
jgi:two-component system, LytTR family, response regulator